MKRFFLIFLVTALGYTQIIAQAENTSHFSLKSDILSNYVWRGLELDQALNFQPNLEFSYQGFYAGLWGSFNVLGTYSEPDYYFGYQKGFFSVTINDYHFMGGKDFFNYKNNETGHVIDAVFTIGGFDNVPINFMFSTIVYGMDKKMIGTTALGDVILGSENNYSTYAELSYALELQDFSFDFFVGASLFESNLYQTDKFEFINIGFKGTKNIVLNEKFSIPMSLSFISNPSTQDVYWVFGITL